MNGDRLGAMLSVHAYALGGGQPLGSVRVRSLDDAVAALKRDPDPLAWSRRRRAIAELMAYGGLGVQFKPQLRALGADMNGLRTALEQRLDALEPYILKNAAMTECTLSNLIADQPGLAGISADEVKLCDWHEEECPTVPPATDGPVKIDARVSIGPPVTLEKIAQNVDPQRWDNCSKFWDPPNDATYIATKVGPDPPHASNPPAAGVPFESLPVLEFFSCSEAGVTGSFKNVLTATTRKTDIDDDGHVHPDGRRMTYSLPPNGFIFGKIGQEDATVIIDGGRVEAWTEGGKTIVKSHKEVQFEDPGQTSSIQVVLMAQELSKELAELACCTGKPAR